MIGVGVGKAENLMHGGAGNIKVLDELDGVSLDRRAVLLVYNSKGFPC